MHSILFQKIAIVCNAYCKSGKVASTRFLRARVRLYQKVNTAIVSLLVHSFLVTAATKRDPICSKGDTSTEVEAVPVKLHW